MSDTSQEGFRASWPHLKKHNDRNSLFVIKDVSLQELAKAVAEDRSQFISKLIEEDKMRRPTKDEIDLWSSAPEWNGHLFPFVIVQPFVFVEYPLENH